MDRRIIRFNNCIQMAACICDIIAIFMAQARDLAHILNLIAEIVWYSTQVQVQVEIRLRSQRTSGVTLRSRERGSSVQWVAIFACTCRPHACAAVAARHPRRAPSSRAGDREWSRR
jgi:hypothetical protein